MQMLNRSNKADSIESTPTFMMTMHSEETAPPRKMDNCLIKAEEETSRLLSLPKELRLHIWRCVLTDQFLGERILRIGPKYPGSNSSSKRFSNSLCKSTQTLPPPIKTVFEEPGAAPIHVSLLRTNWLIYEEALPILYHSVKFCPWALGGFLPVFLQQRSPFARSHVRYVKLYIREEALGDLFSWAITCAQVAKLNDSLRLVEIDVDWLLPENERVRRRLLYPLLKIKAPKKFVGAHHVEFQEALVDAAKDWEAKALVRRACTVADAAARAKQGEPPNKKQRLQEVVFRAKSASLNALPIPGQGEIAQDSSTISGSQQSETDLQEWDMASIGSASPSRKRGRTECISDEEIWVDEAPIIIVKEDYDINDDESEDWELID
ncbi:Nn.00g046360.m01.CDS01 [Neocucurbitaria sp. VM-36]